MTDEEKEAIQYFKWKLWEWYQFTDEERVNILLNLIQKQEQEINKLNNAIDRMAEKIKKDTEWFYTEWFYSEFDNKSKEEIKEYFMEDKE